MLLRGGRRLGIEANSFVDLLRDFNNIRMDNVLFRVLASSYNRHNVPNQFIVP
jgi:hypothetical protein